MWLVRALSTSIGKKFVMAITGLLLCSFLAVHLAGNLLLLVGAQAYNDYAHTLHKNPGLIKVAEAGLVTLFLLHIFLAIQTGRENSGARQISYSKQQSKISDRVLTIRSETWMFVSGAIVLGFLLLHIFDFTLEGRSDIVYEGVEPFEKAVAIMKTPLSFWVYLVGCTFLGAHLGHGFASAFQSLGLNHPRYDKLIHVAGIIFALVVALGFLMFPLWAMGR